MLRRLAYLQSTHNKAILATLFAVALKCQWHQVVDRSIFVERVYCGLLLHCVSFSSRLSCIVFGIRHVIMPSLGPLATANCWLSWIVCWCLYTQYDAWEISHILVLLSYVKCILWFMYCHNRTEGHVLNFLLCWVTPFSQKCCPSEITISCSALTISVHSAQIPRFVRCPDAVHVNANKPYCWPAAPDNRWPGNTNQRKLSLVSCTNYMWRLYRELVMRV